MSINLTKGSISKLTTEDCKKIGLQPVLQVVGIHLLHTPITERYMFLLSDGSFKLDVIGITPIDDLFRSQRLQKGSIVQLTEFICRTIRGRRIVIVLGVHVILEKYHVIGNPKPFEIPVNSVFYRVSKPDVVPNDYAQGLSASKQKGGCGSQTQSKKRKFESSEHTIVAVAKDVSKIARMMVKKNKEGVDDMGACFEKLEKLGWGTEHPMYDTAILLFGQSADYRKLWLHLKLESCGKWVKNAGSVFGLLG